MKGIVPEVSPFAESRRSVKGGKRPSRLSSLSSLLNGKPPIKQCRVRPLQRRVLLEIRRVGAAGRQAEWYRGSNDFALVSAGAFSGFETTGVFLCSTHIGKQSEPHKLYSNPSLSQSFCQAFFKKPCSPVSPKNKYDSK